MDEQVVFDDLVRTYTDRVRGYFWHAWRLSEADADELTQEAFLEVWRALPGFRSECSVLWWILRICRRMAWRYVRRQQIRSFFGLRSNAPLEHEAADERLGATLEARSEIRALICAMKRLTATDRELIYLHYVEDLKEPEMAEILEINRHTLHTRLNHARRRLHRLFRAS